MNSLEKSRSSFYKELTKETGLTNAQIKKVLAEQEIHRFDPKKRATYRATVLAYSGAFKRVEKVMSDTPKPKPCPMPGCKGHKQSIVNGQWICTIGGSRHYWATFVAKATGEKPEEVLVTLTDMKGKQEAKDKEARKQWLQQMRE